MQTSALYTNFSLEYIFDHRQSQSWKKDDPDDDPVQDLFYWLNSFIQFVLY